MNAKGRVIKRKCGRDTTGLEIELLSPEHALTVRSCSAQETTLPCRTQGRMQCLISERYNTFYFGCLLLAKFCSKKEWSIILL